MNSINYPFLTPPITGQTIEIVDGLYWLRLPLPFSPGHVNCYLLADGDGFYIVDTGMLGDETQSIWRHYLQLGILKDKQIKGVIVTHLHPDHIGQAGWLVKSCDSKLLMTESEYNFAQHLLEMETDQISDEVRLFYTKLGLDKDILSGGTPFSYPKKVEVLPNSYQVMRDGDQIKIGGRVWKVIVGRGHSPEHLCLCCDEHNLLIAGDQVISTITSNVSVWPNLPESNPMALWLQTIDTLMNVSDATLVLPAHTLPFFGLHQRLIELKSHHENHFLALEQACSSPQLIVNILPVLFERKLAKRVLYLAVGECLAHLHYLIGVGRMVCIHDQHGLNRYQTTDPRLSARKFVGGSHEKEQAPENF